MHRVIGIGIVEALAEIFTTQAHADKVIERFLKTKKKWGARDRKEFAETVYSIVRWWRYLWFLQGCDITFRDSQWWITPPEGRAQQPLEPADLEEIFLVYLLWHKQPIPDWSPVEIDQKSIQRRMNEKPPRSVRESIPDWLDELCQSQLGDSWPEILRSLNQQAPVFLRTNTLRISPPVLVQELKHEGLEVELVEDVQGCLRLLKRQNVFVTQSFKKGLFEVQDAASQKVAGMMDLGPGLRVVDACAGAGGKALHMASLMKNKGKIIALDIHLHKLEELKKRAARGGVDIIETRVIDSKKVIKRLSETADRVLLDVPCTGLGVLKRNPDTKWKINPDGYAETLALQKELLDEYSAMVKVGGLLVYATCSILPEENIRQVEAFLARGQGHWELEKSMTILPDSGYDGFFAATLKRAK